MGLLGLIGLIGLIGLQRQPYGICAPETAWDQLITVVRVVIGDAAWMQGDLYLHRGIDENDRQEQYNIFRPYDPYALFKNADHTGEACGREHDAEHDAPDMHLAGRDEAQLLPLFWLTSKADPHNIQNWSVGSYWLARVGHGPAALSFLEQGLQQNPDSPVLALDLGVMLFNTGGARGTDRITNLLWRALGGMHTPQERRRAYTYLGAALRTMNAARALADLRLQWSAEFPVGDMPTPLYQPPPDAP
ncbi:MAG: hypothetical protein NTV22_17515 [bacterium]|nr:hypothetical protein [bacterium]